jgi:DNA repair and recombination protein RAD52
MTFTAEQKAALSADLDRRNVRTRSQSGRQLCYVEGWHVIAEANRIFGFDGWDRETAELKCVSEREREIGKEKAPGFGVSYMAKVRVQVGTTVREGCGVGHGIDRDLGQAHESALKEAETDAMKRALMTFGNPFGLALYDKEQAHVSDSAAKAAFIEGTKAAIRTSHNPIDLLQWWNSDEQKQARRDYGLTVEEVSELKAMVLGQRSSLEDGKDAA